MREVDVIARRTRFAVQEISAVPARMVSLPEVPVYVAMNNPLCFEMPAAGMHQKEPSEEGFQDCDASVRREALRA